VKSSAATTASATFTYGPATVRDRFLDWARDHGLPTGSGRAVLATDDSDQDQLDTLVEFLVDGDPAAFDPNPVATTATHASFLLRDLTAEDAIDVVLELSTDLGDWQPVAAPLAADPDQAGVPSGFTRYRVAYPGGPRRFARLRAE
jgi:hypothetical protein